MTNLLNSLSLLYTLIKSKAMKTKFKIGQTVKCETYFGNFESKIISTGTHKGIPVYDLENNYWVYESQVKAVIK